MENWPKTRGGAGPGLGRPHARPWSDDPRVAFTQGKRSKQPRDFIDRQCTSRVRKDSSTRFVAERCDRDSARAMTRLRLLESGGTAVSEHCARSGCKLRVLASSS